MAAETVQHQVSSPPTKNQPELQKKALDIEKKHDSLPVPSSRPPTPPDIARNRELRRRSIPKEKLKIEDFELIKTLGTGTFARVWLVRWKGSEEGQDQVFALKVLRKADVIQLKQVEHVRNENISLAAVAGHPFITTLISTFSDDECLYMLLEYCPGGEIFSFLRRAKRFNEATARFYAAEIVLIFEFLHDVQGVAYRDLKPENLLLDAEGHIKLVDFGFAKRLYSMETYTLCGTPEYLAPEVIHNRGHGLAVDWWALGILIYEFLVGQPPFWDPNPMCIYEQIVEGHIRFPHNISPAARDIISGLCKTNPSERLGYISGGTQRVKNHPFFKDINWDDLYNRKTKGPIIPRVDHAADAGNFEEYPPPPDPSTQAQYTPEMREQYEEQFRDF
ncbi:hypothetical protein VTO42DRAFT_5562 [Malbranchea cinnamomea]